MVQVVDLCGAGCGRSSKAWRFRRSRALGAPSRLGLAHVPFATAAQAVVGQAATAADLFCAEPAGDCSNADISLAIPAFANLTGAQPSSNPALQVTEGAGRRGCKRLQGLHRAPRSSR